MRGTKLRRLKICDEPADLVLEHMNRHPTVCLDFGTGGKNLSMGTFVASTLKSLVSTYKKWGFKE